jgi:nucleoid DNA-binding protein
MRKLEITKKLARRAGVSQAEAADRLDQVVHQILSRLREGKDTALPGLGRFSPGPGGEAAFQAECEDDRG